MLIARTRPVRLALALGRLDVDEMLAGMTSAPLGMPAFVNRRVKACATVALLSSHWFGSR